ncbi:universal stress protein [Fibrella sp. HMF5335]|uniref:Universal stress protein n=1 Tax=Fibrella rubiginis TaxID=2817060 RepID=A0A939GK51_9BACT|nr:universal stress protein [Fibrella rubiginis]
MLIAVADSPYASQVARQGFALARELEDIVCLFCVVDDAGVIGEGPYTTQEVRQSMFESAEKTLLKIQDEASDVECQTILLPGDPVQTLGRICEQQQPSYVVIGAHRHEGFVHRLTSRIAEHLIDTLPCPLILVPS